MFHLGRLVSALAAAALLLGLMAPLVGSWSNTNNCGSVGYRICVSKDDNNTQPKNSTDFSDSGYSGDFYTGTNDSINNSISSMQNWYSNRDVYFYTNSAHEGSRMCVDSLYGYSSIAWGWDDNFESHLRLDGDGYC